MVVRVSHTTTYSYATPARGAIQLLRLTPRDHEGQHVRRWRIDIEPPTRLRASEDAFGNVIHQFDLEGPFQSLRVHVEGEVDTMDAAGVVRGAAEMFPPSLFVRETPLTAPDDALRAFAAELGPTEDSLAYLHALTRALHARLRFEVGATHPSTTAAQAFALGRGVCQDFAHVFIAGARSVGLPARYVSGYLARSDGVTLQDASHAWAEAFLPDLGWVGFDPANGVSPTERYVRVAAALDYLGAAPILGARQGGGVETLGVRLSVDALQRQSQS